MKYKDDEMKKRRECLIGLIIKYMVPEDFYKKAEELHIFYDKNRELFDDKEKKPLDDFFRRAIGPQGFEETISRLTSIDQFLDHYKTVIANIRKHKMYKEKRKKDTKGQYSLYEDLGTGDRTDVARKLYFSIFSKDSAQEKMPKEEKIAVHYGIVNEQYEDILRFFNPKEWQLVDGPTKIRLKRVLDMDDQDELRRKIMPQMRHMYERAIQQYVSYLTNYNIKTLWNFFEKIGLKKLDL